MHHICDFVNFVCHLLFSLSFCRSLHPLLFMFGRCFENVLPAAVGSMILKVACIRNLEPRPSWPSNLTEKLPSWGHGLHFKVCKIHWKMCISCLWPSSGVHFVCPLLFHLCLYRSDHSFRLNFTRFLEKCSPPSVASIILQAASM